MFFILRRRKQRAAPSPTSRKKYLALREQARIFVKERIAVFNLHYGHAINRIAIRDTKSRWGSCSQKGNLNFNYKIALLPTELADYIIVHELCHLRELNHSPAFWTLVTETLPNHKNLRTKLRKISSRDL